MFKFGWHVNAQRESSITLAYCFYLFYLFNSLNSSEKETPRCEVDLFEKNIESGVFGDFLESRARQM